MQFKSISTYWDMRFVFELFKKKRQLKNINNFNSFEEYMTNKLRNYYHVFHFIYDEDIDKNMGCIYTYDYRQVDGHCKIAMLLEKKYEDKFDLVLERFIKEIKLYYPVRKFFVESSSEFEMNKYCEFGFELEAKLQNSIYLNGRYVDEYILGYKVLNGD